MMSDLELREQLANFLANKMSRDEFEDWFVQNSWNAHQQADLAAQRLAAAIELRLAENESAHLSDSELHRELAELLKRPFVVSNISVSPAQMVSTASSFEFSPQSWEVLSADIRYVVASSSPIHH